jgi:hypothetical protein
MEKYYKTLKTVAIVTAILMVVLFIVSLFLGNGSAALTALGMAGLLFAYVNDLNMAENWYNLMNRYWDIAETRGKIIDVYKDIDRISNNALKLAQEFSDDSHTYLDTLSEMNKLTNFFLEGIDDEAALAVNEEMKETNLYLRKIDGKWVLCCRKPW